MREPGGLGPVGPSLLTDVLPQPCYLVVRFAGPFLAAPEDFRNSLLMEPAERSDRYFAPIW